jgi:hypothetical protein
MAALARQLLLLHHQLATTRWSGSRGGVQRSVARLLGGESSPA